MADVVREIDRVVGKLVLAMGCFGVLSGAGTYLVVRNRQWRGVFRWGSVLAGMNVGALAGGYWYRVKVLTNREDFLLQLGTDPRYTSARSRFKRPES